MREFQTKYAGTSIDAEVHGKRLLKLLNHGETYEMNCPHLSIRILPVPRMDWIGNVNIRCPETGLVAEISYTSSHSLFGFGGNRNLIKGKILDSSLFKVLYEVDGHWDKYVYTLSNSNISLFFFHLYNLKFIHFIEFFYIISLMTFT